jgi:hypothetical protein
MKMKAPIASISSDPAVYIKMHNFGLALTSRYQNRGSADWPKGRL